MNAKEVHETNKVIVLHACRVALKYVTRFFFVEETYVYEQGSSVLNVEYFLL